MSPQALATRYAELQQQAEERAGDLLDIPGRAKLLHGMYRESGGNHVFPLLAAHGALWAATFFDVGGSLGRLIARRYFYNSRERAFRLGLLETFANDFRAVNRQVCIDSWANFQFVREHGHETGAEAVVPPTLLAALNHVHDAVRSGKLLGEAEREAVFRESFHWEQELTVAAGVSAAVSKFECPILKALCLKPPVRFAYFPRWKYIWFRNFSDKSERIRKGLLAFEYAQQRGWAGVEERLLSHHILRGI